MSRQESTQRNAPPGLRPQTSRVSALRFPAALETRGLPSVASPFAGASDHRTLAFSRLTPRPSVYLKGSAEGPFFAPAFLLRSKDRCAPSVVRPLAGAGIHWIPAFLRLAPVPAADAGDPSPAPYGPALRLHSGLSLTKGAQKKHFTSTHSRLTCVGLGFGCAPHSA